MKILIIVSSTAQIKMFKPIVQELNDSTIKFIDVGLLFNDEMVELLRNFNYKTMDKFNDDAVNKILIEENPNIIATGNDQTFMDITFIKSANNMKIPSFTVQDGNLYTMADNSFKERVYYLLKSPIKFIELLIIQRISLSTLIYWITFRVKDSKKYSFAYGHGESTKIALFGESSYNTLIKAGISPDKLQITGNPKFDSLRKYKNKKLIKSLKKKYIIPKNRTIILLITQQFVEFGYWTKENRYEFVSEIVRAISKLDNVKLIIKIRYPNENKNTYIKILDEFSIDYEIFDKEPIEEIYSIADVVIGCSSTALLEAMILCKKIMVINLFNEIEPLVYKNSGAIYIENANEIFENLNSLINDVDFFNKSKLKQFVYEQAYNVDGNSSKRIAELIKKTSKRS